MTAIFTYLRESASIIDKWLLLFCIFWASLLIVLNYAFNIESGLIKQLGTRFDQFVALFGVYCCAFIAPYWFAISRHLVTPTPTFWLLLVFAPAIFALKVSISNPLENIFDGIWGDYWVAVTTLPFKFLVVLVILVVLYRILPAQPGFWGVTLRSLSWKPYLLMLVAMVPLIVFASTQAVFLSAYPRVKQIAYIAPYNDSWFATVLLYEIGYGIDFVTIELFFRGFLVFAFVRYAGASALLPMAVFYCSIHFGKPLMECISSFFGGLILGVIAYRTRSIVGGLVVHLGIAWMMEIGGFMGNGVLK